MASPINFVSNFRDEVEKLLMAVGNLTELRQQYTWEDLGNVLSDGTHFNNDLHDDINKAKVVAAVGSFDALVTLLGQGHGTNFSHMRR